MGSVGALGIIGGTIDELWIDVHWLELRDEVVVISAGAPSSVLEPVLHVTGQCTVHIKVVELVLTRRMASSWFFAEPLWQPPRPRGMTVNASCLAASSLSSSVYG